MSVLTYIQTIYNSVSSWVTYIYTFIITLVDLNFKAVTATVETCQDIVSAIVNVFRVLNSLLSNVLSSAFDFIVEIFGLLQAVTLVLWKFLVFLGYVVYSTYQCVEIVFYFIVTNTIWLLRVISSGAYSSRDTFIEVLSTISRYVVLGFNRIVEGVGLLGTSTGEGIKLILKSIKWTLASFWSNIDNGMMTFAESVRYITDSVYFGMLDLVYLKRETFMGLLICVLFCLVVANLYRGLKHRGMTFPGIQDNFEVNFYARERPNFGFDFSDNEEDETDENIDDESDITVASSEADDDEVEEYEVDDLTTDDEELSDSDSTASIDIQLPPVNIGNYNMRRSTTSSRVDLHTSEDFQKEIEKEKEKVKCVVCQDNEKSVLILPCRHLCLCLHCGNTIARSRNVERRVCPLCRRKIETIMNVYT